MDTIVRPRSIDLLAGSGPGTPSATTLPLVGHKRQFSYTTVAPVKRRKVARPVSFPLSSPATRTTQSTRSAKSGLPRPNMTASNSITLDMLRPHFEEPLAKVAASFGICVTLLKKICRRHGIGRWPHRQITGLRKSIASMEHAIGYFDGARRESYAEQLLKQKRKLAALLDDPTINNSLLARENEATNALSKKAVPLHGHGEPVTSIRASSPRGPLLVESPYPGAPSVSIHGQSSSMWLPALNCTGQSFKLGYHQPCSPQLLMQSSSKAYSTQSPFTPGAANLVPSTTPSSFIQLPPLQRPMLPPISSLVASNNDSFYSSW